ncbi:MAG: DNA-primase RepB domain-containing protein [Vicinamibacterales bacterium]
MRQQDPREPVAWLRTAFGPQDWIALLVKCHRTGESAQRIVPLATATSSRFLAWLRVRNAAGWEIYCGTNAVTPGRRSRTRSAIGAVRHLFIDADEGGQAFLARLSARPALPPPTYVLRTSWNRVHVMWRVRSIQAELLERLQKHLARELGGDPAATSAAQMTRLPGFFNHKRESPFLVTLCWGDVVAIWESTDFPAPRIAQPIRSPHSSVLPRGADVVGRVRAYLQALPAAIEGKRGDAHTFRVCCRVVRGFGLDDDEAIDALADWNARCVPPWSERELRAKLDHARRYGREPIGALLSRRYT